MRASSEPVRAIWTDFGGVLTPPVAENMLAFCARTGIPGTALLDAWWKVTVEYGTDDLMEPLDTPMATEREWFARIKAILLADHDVPVELETFAEAWFDDRPSNAAWIDRLRGWRAKGLFVGLLSNMPPAWDAYWRRMTPEDLFDEVVLSFSAGARKPGREIYELAALRAGVPPGGCLLVDDTAKNCAGAVAAGWQAVHFTDAEQAGAELDRLLAAAPAGGPGAVR